MAKEKPGKKHSGKTQRVLKRVTTKGMPFNYVEAYKSLRTNVKFLMATEGAKSFVITSALQMESKSNVSVNLALTLAEEGKKVVLVDCDLRKPAVQRFLRLNLHLPGITNVLAGQKKLEEVLYRVEKTGLDVLPVGVIPPNPSELLATERMKAILQRLREIYDCVIVDTSPISVVTDAAIIGGMVDGAFLVVRSDYAPVEMVKLAKKKLESVQVKIYGVILSRFNAKKSGRASGYYYSYNDYYYSYNNKEEK